MIFVRRSTDSDGICSPLLLLLLCVVRGAFIQTSQPDLEMPASEMAFSALDFGFGDGVVILAIPTREAAKSAMQASAAARGGAGQGTR